MEVVLKKKYNLMLYNDDKKYTANQKLKLYIR